MAAPDIIPPPEPMELSSEEIQRIHNTQHFKSQIYSKETLAVWKIPTFSENWLIHLKSCFLGGCRLAVDFGNGGEENGGIVKFTFNLELIDGEDFGGFYFYFRPTEIPDSVGAVCGKYRLEFLKADGQVWKSWVSPTTNWRPEIQLPEYLNEIESNYYQYLFGSMDRILNNQELLGADDTLTLRITFTRMASRILEYPNAEGLHAMVAKKADAALSGDMETLLHDPTDADVEIKTKDGIVFKVHKLILKRRVAVFRAMFDTEMVESASGVVETPEISSGAMTILLHYIYSGKLHQNWKQWKALAHEVINGANQYGLDGLIQYYDHMLVTLCNDIDAKDLLEVAKLHGLKQAENDIGKWIRGIVME